MEIPDFTVTFSNQICVSTLLVQMMKEGFGFLLLNENM